MAKEEFKFHCSLRVRWSECDAQGIAYNGSYMVYLDVAQADYFRNMGISIYGAAQRAVFDTVSVKATLEFKAPALVDEILDIYVRVSKIGSTSIIMDMELYREASEELLHRAEIVSASYDAEERVTRTVPDDVRKRITHYEETGQVMPTSTPLGRVPR